MEQIKLFDQQAEENLAEIRALQSQIDALKSGNGNFLPTNLELHQLITENSKLKHRLTILNRAIETETMRKQSNTNSTQNTNTFVSPQHPERLTSIYNLLIATFTHAIRQAYPDLAKPPVIITTSNRFGDYQCNSVMALTKMLGKGTKPQEIAQRIVDRLPVCPLIEKVDITGAFINIYLSRRSIEGELGKILQYGVKAPLIMDDNKKRVLVDFSSPNIAKEMHVGHLRSTIIGESICRLLEFLGYDVLRINHVGDWGTQFGMLIAHLEEVFPNFEHQSPDISNLQAFYKESKQRFDSDEVFKQRAYESVVKLQSYDEKHIKAWNLICDVSRREFQLIYDRLDITLIERGESFYQKRMIDVVNELKGKNLLELDEGRLIMWATPEDKSKEGVIPMTIVKTDGGFTYDTSDMAAIKQRLFEEKMDWLVYVTDAGQATHFDLLFGCAKRAGLLPERVRYDHVGFGVVLGDDGKKFKTRSGDTVRLCELLDEGLKRALDTLKAKKRDEVLSAEELKKAQESVAYGCIKYADLSHNRNHAYIFSFDKMLEDKGNTAVYLLYAYTRIQSIIKNANLDVNALKGGLALNHDKEWKLGKVLIKFPDVLAKICADLCLHHLCEFCYEIATTFSEFYDNCYCIEKDANGAIIKVHTERILLCELTARVLAQCFYILGLKPVEKM